MRKQEENIKVSSPCCAADDYRLTFLELQDVHQTEIRGKADRLIRTWQTNREMTSTLDLEETFSISSEAQANKKSTDLQEHRQRQKG